MPILDDILKSLEPAEESLMRALGVANPLRSSVEPNFFQERYSRVPGGFAKLPPGWRGAHSAEETPRSAILSALLRGPRRPDGSHQKLLEEWRNLPPGMVTISPSNPDPGGTMAHEGVHHIFSQAGLSPATIKMLLGSVPDETQRFLQNSEFYRPRLQNNPAGYLSEALARSVNPYSSRQLADAVVSALPPKQAQALRALLNNQTMKERRQFSGEFPPALQSLVK